MATHNTISTAKDLNLVVHYNCLAWSWLSPLQGRSEGKILAEEEMQETNRSPRCK
jgi:hypothetical protein